MQLLLEQRQMADAQNSGQSQVRPQGIVGASEQSPLLAQQLGGMPANNSPMLTSAQLQGQAQPPKTSSEGNGGDLLEGDLDANLGMNDDDLLGDFGDDFNILEFADALDGNDTNKTNILDDLEAEDDKDETKKSAGAPSGEAKPPPYVPGAPPTQDPSRGPPPPYPGQQKVSYPLGMVLVD